MTIHSGYALPQMVLHALRKTFNGDKDRPLAGLEHPVEIDGFTVDNGMIVFFPPTNNPTFIDRPIRDCNTAIIFGLGQCGSSIRIRDGKVTKVQKPRRPALQTCRVKSAAALPLLV